MNNVISIETAIDRCFKDCDGSFESRFEAMGKAFSVFEAWRNEEVALFVAALGNNPDLTPAQFARERLEMC